MSTKQNRAARLHAIAEELGVDPELVGVVGKGIRSDEAIREAVKAYIADQVKVDPEPEPEPSTEPKKPRKASLTLSQRRALLRLQDAGREGIVPAAAFRALPFVHLVDVGLAIQDGDAYRLTPIGEDRADEINPGYRVWASGETVVGDGTKPSFDGVVRPPAGTYRQTKAEAAAAKAKADAEAAAKQAEEDAAKKDEDEDEKDAETETTEVVTA